MSYRIETSETVEEAIRRIACEQIDKAINEIETASLDVHEKVHQVRKRCKKLRGLIRLTRPAFEETYQAENNCFRDAAHELSDYRDAKSIIGTYDELMDRFDSQVDRSAFASVRGQLTRRLNAIEPDQIGGALDRVRKVFKVAAGRVCTWELADDGFDAVAGGLSKTRKRAVARMQDAIDDPDSEELHQWRKRVKYHWYHLRLLRPLWRPVMKAFAKQASKLGDVLGDDHDMAVFWETISADDGNFASESDLTALRGLINERRRELQQQAFGIGRRLFAESNSCFGKRTQLYWEAG